MLEHSNIEKTNSIDTHKEDSLFQSGLSNADVSGLADGQIVVPQTAGSKKIAESKDKNHVSHGTALNKDLIPAEEEYDENSLEIEKKIGSIAVGIKDSYAANEWGMKNEQEGMEKLSLPLTDKIISADKMWTRGDKSQAQRDEAIQNTRSELFRKAEFAAKLKRSLNENTLKYASKRKALPVNVRNCMSLEDLRDISYFFSNDKKANEELVLLARGRIRFDDQKIRKAAIVQSRQMNKAVLDIMVQQLMNISLDEIDLSNDEAILQRAGFFNELTQKLRVFKSYLDRSNKYLEAFREKNEKNYQILMRRLNALGAVDDYCRARRLVLLHPVYLRNYNREIGTIYDDRQSFQEKEFSKLLICMRTASKRLYQVFGRSFEGERYAKLVNAQGTDSAFKSEVRAFSENQEKLTETDPQTKQVKVHWLDCRDKFNFQRRERQLRRAGFSGKGGIDQSDINGDNLVSLEQKLSAFLKEHQGLKKQDIVDKSQAFALASRNAPPELLQLFGMYRTMQNPLPRLGESDEAHRKALKELKSHGAFNEDELEEMLADCRKLFTEGDKVPDGDEMYRNLSSAKTLIMMYYDLAHRFFGTYGSRLYDNSEPELIAGLIKAGKGEQFIERLHCVGRLSLLAKRTVKLGGENVNILDVLRQKNLIDDGYLKNIRETAKLLDCYKSINMGGVTGLVNEAVEKNVKDEHESKEKMSDKVYDEIRALTNGCDGLELVYRNDFDRAVGVFLQGSEKRSDEFLAVKRALTKLMNTNKDGENGEGRRSLLQLVTMGKIEGDTEVFPAYLKLYNALSSYIASHINNYFQKGNISEASTLLLHLGRITRLASKKRLCDAIPAPEDVIEKEKTFAREKLEVFAENYFNYSKAVGQDLVASEKEKLTRRWDVLKKVERDIQIMNKYYRKDVQNSSKLLIFMQEYIAVKMNMSMIDSADNREGMEQVLGNRRSQFIKEKTEHYSAKKVIRNTEKRSEDGLNQNQLFEIRRIDEWLIRNAQNGGYLGFIRGSSDRTDIVGSIMKKSARERLYIYYAVENSKARKNPNPYDALKSQYYTPNLEAFKGTMISNKLKFYKRFSGGGYIYWHKLSQALTLCEGNSAVLDNLDEIINKEKAAAGNMNDNKQLLEDEVDGYQIIDRYTDRLVKTISKMIEAWMLQEQYELGRIKADEFNKKHHEIYAEITEYSKSFKTLPDVFKYHNDLKLENDSHDKSKGDKVKEAIKGAGGQMVYFSNIESLGESIASFNELSDGFNSFMESYGSNSEKGFNLIGNAIGIGFSMYALLKNWKTTRNMDRVARISGMALNTAKVVRTSSKLAVAAGSTTTFASSMAGVTAGVVFAGADTAIAITKGWSHYKNGSKRKLASKLASRISEKEKREGTVVDTRYRDGMVRLNRLMGKKQKIDTGTSLLGASTSITAAVLLITTVASGGLLSGITAAVGLISSIGSYAWTNKVAKQMRHEVDASFFKAEEMMEKVREEWQQENGVPLSKKQEARLREQILKRIAASLGYYSPSQMANSIAQNYAGYLLDGAKKQGDEGKMCLSMIKGLGIKVTKNPETGEIESPKVSDIAKKMFG
ncbi:MAG: hypothetical protein K6E91_01235 [Butyrivibrio sp.]|nr:hypothetical protein [Butyrivibrio sp.]